ncbi:MAG: thymidine phosphorylase [Elusimicrobiota bacterium]|nr:thymidine phosphorylase [Elusimicrobiota bacterium]
MLFLDLIAKKRDGGRHTPGELAFVARGAAKGLIPDYQLSAWLMAVLCRGMDERETVELTRAMAESGEKLGLDAVKRPKADKHSTGGVGDGVSLALAPLAAACGLAVPMMSGRGLGHTGGTLDKLEAIEGFRVRLELPEIRAQVLKHGFSLFGQTGTLAPADRTLYALRDATATVPALPLIVASILSKKAAEELDALVLDVKVGSGAIFRDAKSARNLARALVKTAKGLGIPTVAVLTAMEQPLGRFVGNALEVRQAVEILRGDDSAADYLECLLALGGWMLNLAGLSKTPKDGAELMLSKIEDGSGLRLFRDCVAAQGGTVDVIDDLSLLPTAKKSRAVRAAKSGFVSALDARKIGHAAVLLGAGRAYKDQELDYGAGLELLKKTGDRVMKGEPLAILHAADHAKLDLGEREYRDALTLSSKPVRRPKSVVLEIIK